MYHLQFGQNGGQRTQPSSWSFDRCYLFVDLFFILSGFILTYKAEQDRVTFTKAPAIRDFYAARIARVYPLHLFCLLYFAFVMVIEARFLSPLHLQSEHYYLTRSGAISFLEQFALIHAWIPGYVAWNIPSWSISAELAAYAVFPLLFVLRSRVPAFGYLVLLAIPLSFFGTISATTGNLDIISGAAILRCLAGFSLGMLVFYAGPVFRRLSDGLLSTIQGIAAIAIILSLAYPVNDILVIPGFVLIAGATWLDRGVIAHALSTAPMRKLGELSYSIYLNHVCVITIIAPFWARLIKRAGVPDAVARPLEIVMYLAVILLLSHYTYRYVEQPARRFVMQRLTRRHR